MGEDLALSFLRKQGYKILERNFRCPLGELDIVAKEKDTIVFVEIKTRSLRDTCLAKEAVDLRKQRQVSKVALFYLKAKDLLGKKARFDVVAIGKEGPVKEVELIRDAFEFKAP